MNSPKKEFKNIEDIFQPEGNRHERRKSKKLNRKRMKEVTNVRS